MPASRFSSRLDEALEGASPGRGRLLLWHLTAFFGGGVIMSLEMVAFLTPPAVLQS